MAWRLTIGGVDHTAAVDSFTTTVALNDRARATVVVADEQPPRSAELVSYAADGVTPLFGGVILQRSFQGRNPYDPTYQLTLEVGDWLTFADWCYTTRAYPVAVTLKQVLADLVADHLGAYGITLDPAQVDGPTIAPFTWTIKRVADALRELSDRTTYVVRIDPAKRLRMFVPATLPAPVALTEAAPHCQEITWRDSDRTPYNAIILLCGPQGIGEPVPYHWVGNAGHVYSLAGVAVPASSVWPGIAFVDGVQYPIWKPGEGPADRIEWDYALDGGTLTFIGAAASFDTVGADIGINYQPQFPFTVTRSTGATPVVEQVETRPDVLSIPVAEEIADTLLAQAQAAPREAVITTDQDGFVPGQALTIDLPTTRSITGTFLITSVALTIVQDTARGDRFWQYTLEAVDSDLYHGSYLDDWREIAGVGGGTTTVTGGGSGGGGGDGAMLPLPAGQIYVGTSGNVAAAVPMSGDVGINPAGATTVIHVVNEATTATPSVVPQTIMLRDGAGDASAHTVSVSGEFVGPVLRAPGDLHVNAAGNLWIDPPAGSIALQPAAFLYLSPASRVTIPDLGYKQNLGQLTNKFLTIHAAELWVESLVAQNTIATIGGRVLVAPTTILARDLAAGATRMYVKHNAFKLHVPGVELGSKLVMQSAGKYEAFAVADTAVPAAETDGSFGYTVLRDQAGSGGHDWYAGDAVLDTGKSDTTSGIIDLYAVSGLLPGTGIGPAIVGNVRTGINSYDLAPRWAIGNLKGTYGYSADVFGAAFGVPTGAWVKIDPIDGVRIGHATTTVSQIDANGNAFFIGTIVAAGGTIGGWNILPNYLYAPATNTSVAFNSAVPSIEIGDPRPTGWATPQAGIWMGKDADGKYKFRASSATGVAGFFWDGNVATFRGDGAGVTNIHGGNIQTGTVTANAIAANTITGGQIAGDTITAAHLAAGSVTSSELAAGAVTAGSIAARSITADRIVVGALTSTEIAAGTITGDRIAANTITGDQIVGNALSAIYADLGNVTAGTITGVTINGTTINGSTVHGGLTTLDSNGLTMSPSGSGGDSATIKLGTIQLWGNNANTLIDSGNLDVYGWMHATGDISGTSATLTGYLSAAGVIACGTMNTVAGGVRAVYFNYGNNQFCFWTGAASDRVAVLPWVPPDDPLALLDVPIVTYAAGDGRELGIVVEALAAVAPEAVTYTAAGAPEGVRDQALTVYLLAVIKAIHARLRALEGKT